MSLANLPPGTDLSKIPMMPNPSGAPPDLEHAPTLFPTILGVAITLFILTGNFVAFRVYFNFVAARQLGLDDCTYFSGCKILICWSQLLNGRRFLSHSFYCHHRIYRRCLGL
jgi:hypothetical protein